MPTIGEVRPAEDSMDIEVWDGQNWVDLGSRPRLTEEFQPSLPRAPALPPLRRVQLRQSRAIQRFQPRSETTDHHQILSELPENPQEGQISWNNEENYLCIWTNGQWLGPVSTDPNFVEENEELALARELAFRSRSLARAEGEDLDAIGSTVGLTRRRITNPVSPDVQTSRHDHTEDMRFQGRMENDVEFRARIQPWQYPSERTIVDPAHIPDDILPTEAPPLVDNSGHTEAAPWHPSMTSDTVQPITGETEPYVFKQAIERAIITGVAGVEEVRIENIRVSGGGDINPEDNMISLDLTVRVRPTGGFSYLGMGKPKDESEEFNPENRWGQIIEETEDAQDPTG